MTVKTSAPDIRQNPSADYEAIQQGMAALRSNRGDDAERIARALLSNHPENTDALHLLGLSFLVRQRPSEAIAPLLQSAGGSSNPVMETHCAVALRAAGRLPEALSWLERAVSRQPSHLQAFLELGVALAALQRYDEAEAALQRGLVIDPNAVEIAVELGGVYICRAEPAKAAASFARALALAPGHLRALHGSGTALLFQGAFERAADSFRQVLARQPDHLRARIDLAHCLLELGRWDEGVGCLRRLLAAAPQYLTLALRVLVSSGRGKFWLQPSAAAAVLMSQVASPAGIADGAR